VREPIQLPRPQVGARSGVHTRP